MSLIVCVPLACTVAVVSFCGVTAHVFLLLSDVLRFFVCAVCVCLLFCSCFVFPFRVCGRCLLIVFALCLFSLWVFDVALEAVSTYFFICLFARSCVCSFVCLFVCLFVCRALPLYACLCLLVWVCLRFVWSRSLLFLVAGPRARVALTT